MKIEIFKIVLVVMLFAFFSSCKKDATVISPVPEISFVSATPQNVKEYSDQLTIVIGYKDGDGDLGENNPDVKNLFVTDNRINITYQFRLQQLAPDDANVPIQGNVNVLLPVLGITDGSNSQQATFSIHVIDRSGNESNTIQTTSVTISK